MAEPPDPRHAYAVAFWFAAWGALQLSYSGAAFLFVCGLICALSTDRRPSDGQAGAGALAVTALMLNVMALVFA